MSDPRARSAVRADTRRRVLEAFVTQGRSDEAPAGARTRPLTVGMALVVLLLVGGVVSSRLSPSSPGVWSDGDVIVSRSSAARLVSVAGVLHPLLNAASGRLLRPATSPGHVVVVDDTAIAGARRGAPLGIPGAPDVLPTPAALVQTGWLSCLDGTGVRTRIASASTSGTVSAPPPSGTPTTDLSRERAVVVAVTGPAGGIYLVAADHHYRIPTASYPAVKQYLDQTRSPEPAPAGWVDLFSPGTDLAFASFRFAAAAVVGQEVGQATVGRPTSNALALRGTVPMIGQLVTNTDRADASFVIVADGTVPLTAFATAVYRATAPAELATPLAVTDTDLARLPPSAVTSFTPPDWPAILPLATPLTASSSAAGSASAVATTTASTSPVSTPCAELDAPGGRSPTTHLRFTTAGGTAPAPVVQPGGGAVVTVVTGVTGSDARTTYLVDPSGRAFPLGMAAADTLARLGYADVVAPTVPAAWIALCPPGPELSAAAAQPPTVDSTSS